MCDRRGRKVAVSMGKATKRRVSIDVSEDVLMSFCVAGAWHLVTFDHPLLKNVF